MKTKKITTFLLILSLCFPIVSQSQLTPKTPKTSKEIKSLPAYITNRVNEISSKIVLTKERQLQIGKALLKRDSLRKADPDTKLKLHNIDTKLSILKSILSPEELDNYLYAKDPNNRFLLAIKEATLLMLKPVQIEKIRNENYSLDTIAKMTHKEEINYYNTKLKSTLSDKQFQSLVRMANEKKSIAEAKKDWKIIKKLNIVAPKDSTKIFKELFDYRLNENSLLDQKFNEEDKSSKRSLKKQIVLQKPAILIRAEILSDNQDSNNDFATIIKYEKDLNLTSVQVDSVLSKYTQYTMLKANLKAGTEINKKHLKSSFKNDNISDILTPNQVEIYLLKKNQKEAEQIAANNWDALDKEGLCKNLDKNTTIRELADYQLKYLIANERLKMNKNQMNLFYKRDVELKKPALLKQFDNIKTTEKNAKNTKNTLKW